MRHLDIGGGLASPTARRQVLSVDERRPCWVSRAIAISRTEPGRWIVAPAGCVTQSSTLRSGLAADRSSSSTGMTDLIRPAFYGAYHSISRDPPGGNDDSREIVDRSARPATRWARINAAPTGGGPDRDSRHRRAWGGDGLEPQSPADCREVMVDNERGASPAAGRRSTTCCSGTSNADCF